MESVKNNFIEFFRLSWDKSINFSIKNCFIDEK